MLVSVELKEAIGVVLALLFVFSNYALLSRKIDRTYGKTLIFIITLLILLFVALMRGNVI